MTRERRFHSCVVLWSVRRLLTIRVRLTLWYMALLLVTLAAFSAFLCLRLAQNLRDDTDDALRAEARQVGSTLLVTGEHPSLGSAMEQVPTGMVLALYDLHGVRLEADARAGVLPQLPAPQPQQMKGNPTIVSAHSKVGVDDWRVLTYPVMTAGHLVAVLQVAQSQEPAERALRQLVLLMAIAIPAVVVVAGAGGVFLAGQALGPIDRITRTARRISAEDLSQRLNLPAGTDEVGRLAGTFDQMLDRLELAFARQRQFTADASHELRTPLAALAAQAELALEQVREPEAYRGALAEIQRDAQRLTELLAQLLVLARADSGHARVEQEPLDLTALAADVVATLTPLAEAGGVNLAAEGGAPALLTGDQTRLTQLIVNLVDNALQFTPPGGRVRVSVTTTAEEVQLQVTDTGAGIAAEHLPHVFERFYRVDAARTRDDGGAGLGLAIAEWIAQAHGGRIGVDSTAGQGTTFSVLLPRRAASLARSAR